MEEGAQSANQRLEPHVPHVGSEAVPGATYANLTAQPATGRWVETLFRALSDRVADRRKFVSFRGKDKAEWGGVVDLVAIRKSSAEPGGDLLKRGDLFDLILIQLKGGGAPAPSEADCLRLREVKRRYRATKVVLLEAIGS